jgi:hypothetical protein
MEQKEIFYSLLLEITQMSIKRSALIEINK